MDKPDYAAYLGVYSWVSLVDDALYKEVIGLLEGFFGYGKTVLIDFLLLPKKVSMLGDVDELMTVLFSQSRCGFCDA